MQELLTFEKISDKEYQLRLNGKLESIFCPFGKTELLFKTYLNNGGIIDPVTQEIQTDLASLITSFREVGNILLSEYDSEGTLIKARSCSDLTDIEVITLFQIATKVIESFIEGLQMLQTAQMQSLKEKAKSQKKD